MKLFGWELTKSLEAKRKKVKDLPALVPQLTDEAEITTAGAAGHFGQYVNLGDVDALSEKKLITQCREVSTQPEVDSAISDIVDLAIASGKDSKLVKLDLDEVDQPDSIKTKINDEFNNVLRLLKFNKFATDIFRTWYIDGRLYHHIMSDPKKPKEGIKELRRINPMSIRKMKEVEERTDQATGAKTKVTVEEFYLYTPDEAGADHSNNSTEGVKVSVDAVVHTASGLSDKGGNKTISHLFKALKPANQLRMLEDALVIYRIARAPERRVFYIDVGSLPKGKAEQYVQNIMSKYRNKLTYDAETGDIKDSRKTMSMLEDFWLPRKEGGRGTEITTLPGGENLGQIDDILFFQKKLFRSLNVPLARLEQESVQTFGRSGDITREEVKFQKFIDKLRRKFSYLFIEILRVQLLLKGIITAEEWPIIESDLAVDFLEDNYFSELKEIEIIRDRLGILTEIGEYDGKYFSGRWIQRNILNFTDEEMKEMQVEIDAEKAEAEKNGEGEADDDF